MVTLDLHAPRGRELFLELVRKSDVILENFRPGTLKRWDLGYDVLKAANPDVVLVRVSGYGPAHTGTRPASARPRRPLAA